MDLRDEVAGTEGTIWLNHFLRTGYEMYSTGGGDGYVAEKLESTEGWLFPVGDEVSELGYVDMFTDMFNAIERAPTHGDLLRRLRRQRHHGCRLPLGRDPPVGAGRRRVAGRETERIAKDISHHDGHAIVKEEVLPDGRRKLMLSDKDTGAVFDIVTDG